MTRQSKKKYCFLTKSKSSSCELKSFQLYIYHFPWASLLLRSQWHFLGWVFTMKIPSQPLDIFVSWSKYLLTFWEHLIVESFFQGIKISGEHCSNCLAFQNGHQTSRERKPAVNFQIWSFTYIAGYLSCTDQPRPQGLLLVQNGGRRNSWPRLPKRLQKFVRISLGKHDKMSSFRLDNGCRLRKTNRAARR